MVATIFPPGENAESERTYVAPKSRQAMACAKRIPHDHVNTIKVGQKSPKESVMTASFSACNMVKSRKKNIPIVHTQYLVGRRRISLRWAVRAAALIESS